jgi:hypothetical protein
MPPRWLTSRKYRLPFCPEQDRIGIGAMLVAAVIGYFAWFGAFA